MPVRGGCSAYSPPNTGGVQSKTNKSPTVQSTFDLVAVPLLLINCLQKKNTHKRDGEEGGALTPNMLPSTGRFWPGPSRQQLSAFTFRMSFVFGPRQETRASVRTCWLSCLNTWYSQVSMGIFYMGIILLDLYSKARIHPDVSYTYYRSSQIQVTSQIDKRISEAGGPKTNYKMRI